MPLVVPALRFFLVFLNIYETFKTLKPPPPSTRRGGQPSVRAISQRKRDLKGCLVVWVVWCCYAAYERTFDRVVSIFLPFYSEIKSVFLLFLVLTRAKGAEPLFLHVLRPLIKPYAAVVDPMLELSCDIGDFIFALLQVPLDYFFSSSWFSFSHNNSEGEPSELSSGSHISFPDSGSSIDTRNHSGVPVLANHGVAQTLRTQQKRSESIRSVSDPQLVNGGMPVNNCANPSVSSSRHSKSASTTSLPAYSEHPSYAPPRYSQTLSRHIGYQTWRPPAASGGDPPIPTRDSGTAPEYHSPEWRTYPAFPSAYPPTPLPASASLPSSTTARLDYNRCHLPDTACPHIPEDEQGSGEMLERPHEERAGSVHSSMNGDEIIAQANGFEYPSDATRQPDEDTFFDDSMCSSEAGLSEDDFGASLRTPYRSPAAIPSGTCSSSVDSLTNAPTAANHTSHLRTKTSSESLSSGSSSLAGRKRNHGTLHGATRYTPMTSSRNATLRAKPAPLPIHQDVFQSSTSEGEDEGEVGDDYRSVKAKRQRVLDPVKRKSTVRPATRGGSNARKATLAFRGARAVSTAHEGTVQRKAGSVVTNNTTVKGRKPMLSSRQVVRDGAQGVIKSSSTSSSQSGTLRGRAQ